MKRATVVLMNEGKKATTNRRTPRTAAWGLVTLVVLCGCGDGRLTVHPARGRVVYGQAPAQHALVIFHPQGDLEELNKLRPHGVVEADGSFTLTTYRPGDGAPAGQYRVTVEWPSPLPGEGSGDDPEQGPTGPDFLQGRYADPATTPLSAEVTNGANTLPPFQVH